MKQLFILVLLLAAGAQAQVVPSQALPQVDKYGGLLNVITTATGYWTNYTIDTSNDGLSWTTQFTKTGGTGGVETDTFTPVTARYIRVNGTARSGTPALEEFEVYSQ